MSGNFTVFHRVVSPETMEFFLTLKCDFEIVSAIIKDVTWSVR